ncbi:MAG: LolA-like outer membrane lipoprotein chaperone [Sulfurovum sp.]|nr:LolA-like outer membrane lipoprotein chaperone [Sulfurovum sp.]
MKFLLLFVFLSTLLFSTIILPPSFRANFSQKITNTKQKVLQYSGKVSFSNTSHFKWQYLKPTQKEVCTDGLELLVVDHDLEQVSVYYMGASLDISTILSQAKHHKDNIYVTLYQKKNYTIKLDKKQHLHSIAYFDDLDNHVQILFSQMKYQQKHYPLSSMKCVYPITYDMIK